MTKRTRGPRLNPLLLILSVGVVLIFGTSGAIPTSSGLPWYATLNKPAFTPPSFLFGPVWTILYVMMGIVLYRILVMKQSAQREELITLFTAQLTLNILWSFLFFGLRNPLFALYDIIFLIFFISRMIFRLAAHDRQSAVLTLPYFFWVSFASVLNYAVWILNA